MGHIRVLPDQLANQIAAGEVVERPASALKELLENSFDAGATQIRVVLEAGGKRKIQVEDNGSGMDRDDCLMALERHATSKLSRTEDLFSIRTLGFRGEALPSIASVSRFRLESRAAEAESGTRVEMHGSKLYKVSEVPRNPGTRVTVENLFFNIPARKKFLRRTETELSWMVHLVTQYSLAHIDKHFYLEHNGRVLMDVPPVERLEERIYQHFGKEMLKELVPVGERRDWLKITGLTSTPNYFKSNRQFQYLFVNGRLVRDRVLAHAIGAAYEGFGEGRAYPVTFLFLEMPSRELDVNVHPAKTEIKFIRSDFVHDSVRDAVRKPLLERRITTPYRFREGYHAHPSGPVERPPDPWSRRPALVSEPAGPDSGPPLPATTPHTGEGTDPVGTAYERFVKRNPGLLGREPSPAAPAAVSTAAASLSAAADEEGLFGGDLKLSLPHIIGQFRDSYILAEQEGDLLLVDQHVAHERILYDQIVAGLERNDIERQALLVPVTVELSPRQAVEMEHLLPALRRFGFDLDAFDGHTFVIRETPLFVKDENLERLVSELVEKAQGKRGETAVEAITDLFAATKACKAAVKINMHLTPEKMHHLVERLWQSSSPLFCPHGRPIILRFRNEEIEKNFHRR